jgi:parallel beta-helix repeat protein
MRKPGVSSFRYVFPCVVFLGFFIAPCAWAQHTIHVPGDATSIQAGIDAASDGDSVVVAPGTYFENIDFKGKNIVVTSSGGPTQTIIDGNGNGAVVTFKSSESRGAVIRGFTIQNGGLPYIYYVGPAGGVFARASNPTIENNIITRNRGNGIQLNGGGLIHGNTISYTTTAHDATGAPACPFDDGSGIQVNASSSVEISNNIIENNIASWTGGGIMMRNSLPLTVSNNIIRNNQSGCEGGGIYADIGDLYLLQQNLIYGNVSGSAGGGVYFSAGLVLITSNTIVGNSISDNMGMIGNYVDGSQLAIMADMSGVGLFNNIIVATDFYDAIFCDPSSEYMGVAPPVVISSDIVNTGGPTFGGGCFDPVGYTGNISIDPKFKDLPNHDFHLLAGSPAIDSGYNAAPGAIDVDFDGNARVQNNKGTEYATVDMGAYEFAGTPDSRSVTGISLTLQPPYTHYGEPVNLAAVVTATSGLPSGTVNFLDDWKILGTSAVDGSGTAMFSTTLLTPGTHSIVASYGGNASLRGSVSSAAGVQVEGGYPTSITYTLSSDTVSLSQPLTLTATVTSAFGNPTGIVEFYADAGMGLFARIPLNANGVASFTTTASSIPGTRASMQAVYRGTEGFISSYSSSLFLTVRDFGLSTESTKPMTLTPGQSSTSTLVIISGGGLEGMATFTCSVPATMREANCSATPIQVGGAALFRSTLTVATTAPRRAAASPSRMDMWEHGAFVLGGVFLLGLPRRVRTRQATIIGLMILVILSMGIVSCGGGGSGVIADSGTPAGTYSLKIACTIGTLTHTLDQIVTVQ